MNTCDICEILPTIRPEYTILETAHWIANLRNLDQTLLGTTFITAKRHVSEVDMLTEVEDLDFLLIRNALLYSLRKSFQPLTFNISCLKNDAFRDAPDQTPTEAGHVHWHVKPRYTSETQVFNSEFFTDPAPGRYLEPSRIRRNQPTEETAMHISSLIRANLPPLTEV